MGCLLAFLNMLAQHGRIHAATANQAKPAGIAHRCCEFPAAAPYHAALNDGIFNAQKPGNRVFHISALIVLNVWPSPAAAYVLRLQPLRHNPHRKKRTKYPLNC